GTISGAKFWTNLPDKAIATKIQRFVFFDNPPLLEDWMSGSISSMDLHQLISAHLGIEQGRIWPFFVRQSQRLKICALNEIRILRPFFITALATSNVDSFSTITCESKALHRYFDSIINSADI